MSDDSQNVVTRLETPSSSRYLDRAHEEFEYLRQFGVQMSGYAFPTVLFIKGELNVSEKTGQPLLGGQDGDALRAALDRLGYTENEWAACSIANVQNRTADGIDILLLTIETFDPELVIALDKTACDDLLGIWDLGSLAIGEPGRHQGRRVLLLDGFETALKSMSEKQRMWAYLKTVKPLSAPM
ncbi:MAG: hypothetical protein IKE43_00320 [Coriobacteriales bacterium]|nr:hypothetical protein [Coriobacteriales bacterium]